MTIHKRVVGDTLSPLPFAITRNNLPLNLTGRVVQFSMTDGDGNIAIAETSTGINITDAVGGLGEYDFAAAGVDVGGVFLGFVHVYGDDSPGEPAADKDTHPPDGITIIITDPVEDRTPDASVNILEQAANPKKTRTDEGEVEERTIGELIQADQYAANQGATTVPFGLRIAKSRMPSST